MTVITDALCPLCGCMCDDITVVVEDNKITEVKHACKLGAAKIMGHDRIKAPMMRTDKNSDFKEVSYEEAIDAAARILAGSKRPLLYGWASALCEVHKKGILLTEELGGIIDNTASVCHGPSALAVHEKGLPSSTLGQIKNRADVVVFWGSNPAHAHPRHMGRYSVFARGFFSEKGRKGRKVIVVDVRKTDTARIADEYIQVQYGSDYLVISALRAILAGHADVVPDTVGGVPKEQLVKLVDTLKTAKFGAVFFGMGLTQSKARYKNIDNAISLTTELNSFTKFVIMPMRGHYNVTGFGQVCTWETGFVTAVDFSRGAPYYNPGETAANDVLARKEIDAAMIIAGDAGAHFPANSVRYLARIPVVQVDPYWNPTTEIANIVIPTAICGIEVEGTGYRMDGVSLRYRKMIEPVHPTDIEVLDRILERVRELRGE
ncbi:formylmethanofuran dehydrogenase, subunit B [Candidatus Methanoperedens nitroreducens]|uniref:Formylmethanofuran dehydrogenase, subunit B n=1 Tax=Candidatus Methanoperedens nitratireducens TaxID=1392998 RepID=A0A062V938_9EURY|nr:formylmethanofuran dehydrogenase subunit B [Candidatus Methanoperedens nitroreducens]KCZ72274.1 formylmethanofuran dehydrogenase, subunit B [Candidatus Methanoperedens nitroreducens]MDJ1420740.1 formylmethanofuran dehydrogenase subunit B [Candidatus Methanoperedens sp.]